MLHRNQARLHFSIPDSKAFISACRLTMGHGPLVDDAKRPTCLSASIAPASRNRDSSQSGSKHTQHSTSHPLSVFNFLTHILAWLTCRRCTSLRSQNLLRPRASDHSTESSYDCDSSSCSSSGQDDGYLKCLFHRLLPSRGPATAGAGSSIAAASCLALVL